MPGVGGGREEGSGFAAKLHAGGRNRARGDCGKTLVQTWGITKHVFRSWRNVLEKELRLFLPRIRQWGLQEDRFQLCLRNPSYSQFPQQGVSLLQEEMSFATERKTKGTIFSRVPRKADSPWRNGCHSLNTCDVPATTHRCIYH